VANPFKYVGQLGVMRDDSGLDYMRNRWYAPNQGRFTQRDPIGLAGGTNLYAYVGNAPTNQVDPLGLEDFDTAGYAPGQEEALNAASAAKSAEALAEEQYYADVYRALYDTELNAIATAEETAMINGIPSFVDAPGYVPTGTVHTG